MFIHSPTDMEGSWKSAWQALAQLLHVPKKSAFYEMPETILNTVGSHYIKGGKKSTEKTIWLCDTGSEKTSKKTNEKYRTYSYHKETKMAERAGQVTAT